MSAPSPGREVASHRRTAPRGRGTREWPIAVVLAGVVGGLAYMGMHHFKRGAVLVAAFVCLAALLRLLLPERLAGLLAVRGRAVDVAVLVVLGLAIAVVTVVVPPPG